MAESGPLAAGPKTYVLSRVEKVTAGTQLYCHYLTVLNRVYYYTQMLLCALLKAYVLTAGQKIYFHA